MENSKIDTETLITYIVSFTLMCVVAAFLNPTNPVTAAIAFGLYVAGAPFGAYAMLPLFLI